MDKDELCQLELSREDIVFLLTILACDRHDHHPLYDSDAYWQYEGIKEELEAAAEGPLPKDRLSKAIELLTEVVHNHCDIDSPDYNECELSPCVFCDEAVKVGVNWDDIMLYTRDRTR